MDCFLKSLVQKKGSLEGTITTTYHALSRTPHAELSSLPVRGATNLCPAALLLSCTGIVCGHWARSKARSQSIRTYALLGLWGDI
jgi:hypothetical protein